jgi:tRNA(Ser,Leu) C12 N-acetylase TAN1
MKDWNVLVTARERGFIRTCELMGEFGPIARTEYYNVLVMKVADPTELIDTLADWARKNPTILADCISRVVPAEGTLTFQSPEEFEAKAREIALGWLPRLAGKSFHVRLHRRGFKGRLSSPQEERFLDELLLTALEEAGTPGSLTFEDPDAVIAVETLGNQAGMSLWTRDDLRRYPFLRLD